MDYTVVIASIVVFLTITFILVGMLLGAKAKLLPSGPVSLQINGDNKVEVSSGSTLLSTLGNNKIFLPSACGGGGTCIQCKCKVLDGGGEILPTETPHFSRKEVAEGWRLGCQVKVKQDMVIQVPEEVFGIKKYEAKVIRNWNVASFIKEFVVEIPEEMDYKAGGYIQIEIPQCEVKYEDIDISAHPEEHPGEPDKFKLEWDKFKLWPLKMKNPETVERAYSMASFPALFVSMVSSDLIAAFTFLCSLCPPACCITTIARALLPMEDSDEAATPSPEHPCSASTPSGQDVDCP